MLQWNWKHINTRTAYPLYEKHIGLHVLQTSADKIESITFRNIKGTSATEDAIVLACSDSYPCKRLYLKDIELTTSSGTAKSFCWEAYGTSSGLVYPKPCVSSGDMIIRHLVKSNSTSSRAYDYALFWAKKLWINGIWSAFYVYVSALVARVLERKEYLMLY